MILMALDHARDYFGISRPESHHFRHRIGRVVPHALDHATFCAPVFLSHRYRRVSLVAPENARRALAIPVHARPLASFFSMSWCFAVSPTSSISTIASHPHRPLGAWLGDDHARGARSSSGLRCRRDRPPLIAGHNLFDSVNLASPLWRILHLAGIRSEHARAVRVRGVSAHSVDRRHRRRLRARADLQMERGSSSRILLRLGWSRPRRSSHSRPQFVRRSAAVGAQKTVTVHGALVRGTDQISALAPLSAHDARSGARLPLVRRPNDAAPPAPGTRVRQGAALLLRIALSAHSPAGGRHLFRSIRNGALDVESPDLAHYPFAAPPGWGYSLPIVYLVWAFVVCAMYPICQWYSAFKARRTDWWLSYL